MAKIAVIGGGKTGSQVCELLDKKNIPFELFNTSNPPTKDKLSAFDCAICFIPGTAFLSYIPLFLAAKINVVSGATGLEWSKELKDQVKAANLTWVYAHNFSLGMNLVHAMINTLKKVDKLYDQYDFTLHEVHHTKKVDAPSGTALHWQKWLDKKVEITSERTGDVVGDHSLTAHLDSEKITLTHNAIDRKIFAKGALWASEKLKALPCGLHNFEDITLKELLS